MEEQNKVTPRWSKTAVTDAGTAMLAEFAAGRILEITAAYGSASAGGELTELAELPDGRAHPLTIESVTRTDNSVTACIQVTSLGNPTPYRMDMVGLYAATRDPVEQREPGEPGGGLWGDKLLMVIEDTEDEQGRKGVTIPAETDQLYTFKLYAVLTVTNKERLEISVSTAGIATMGAIDAAIEEHNQDPDAHPGLMGAAVGAHNESQAAHPGLTARIRAAELAMNGKETIVQEGDPTKETEGAKGQHYINLDSGAEWECTGVTEAGYTWEQVDYNSESYKSMRDILKEAADTAAQAKEVADGAAQAIAAVQNTISVIPSQSGSLTYNGSAQLPSWNNLALEMMTIAYGEDKTAAEDYKGETDAGTYKAYVTPKEGYTWGDKSADEKEVLWTIGRATITTAPSAAGKLTYIGEEQAPTWQNFNPEQLTKTETAQADAGDYSTAFTPTRNYQWSGGDTSARVVKWTIAKKSTSFSVSPATSQSFNVGDTKVIQVTSDSDAPIAAESSDTSAATVAVDQATKTVTITGTGQGTAEITISCKNSTNYADASATIGVSVSRKNPSLSINPAGDKTLAIGGSAQIAVTTDSDGAVSASSNAPGVATASASGKNVTISGASAGSAKVTISVPQTTKYNAASLTLNVTISKPTVSNSSWDDIKAISDAGTAASYFAVGDTKSVTLNGTVGTLALNDLTVNAFILGINHLIPKLM